MMAMQAMLQNAMQEVAAARSGNTAAFSLPFDVADQEVCFTPMLESPRSFQPLDDAGVI